MNAMKEVGEKTSNNGNCTLYYSGWSLGCRCYFGSYFDLHMRRGDNA